MGAGREITLDEVRHMARLSRLKLDDRECALLARQLGKILEHMAELQKIDVTGVEPLYSVAEQPEETRADNPVNLRSRGEVLANAPETDGEYFIVPKIV